MKRYALLLLLPLMLAACAGDPPRYLVGPPEPAFEIVADQAATSVAFAPMPPQALNEYLVARFAHKMKRYKPEFQPRSRQVISASGTYFQRLEVAVIRHAYYYDEEPCMQSLWVWVNQAGEVKEAYVGMASCLV